MNDTHKLLLAFIEASGFDVEKVRNEKLEEFLGVEVPARVANQIDVFDYRVTKKEKVRDRKL